MEEARKTTLPLSLGDAQELAVIIPEGALPGQDLEIPVPRPEQIQVGLDVLPAANQRCLGLIL